jgi:hypothetical protein
VSAAAAGFTTMRRSRWKFGRSAVSRMRSFRVGEMTHNDAYKFLQKNGIKKDLIPQYLEYTGYSFMYLALCKPYSTVAEVAQDVKTMVEVTLAPIKLWAEDPQMSTVIVEIAKKHFSKIV